MRQEPIDHSELEVSLGGRIDQVCDRYEAEYKSGNLPHIEAYLDGWTDEERDLLRKELLLLDSHYRGRAESSQHDSFDHINRICLEFDQSWQRQRNQGDTSFTVYLDQVEKNLKPTLARNLLHIEIKHRRDIGETPNVEEYLARLPQHESVVRQVFLHSVSASFDGDSTSPVATLPIKLPAARHLGEYQIIRELGRGGMGFVFEAEHMSRRDRVALKTLPISDGAMIYRFKREFRSLVDVNHENLVGLYELESDGDQWFFTMELIDGVDFLQYVRPNGNLDESRLRPALAQLIKAVLALHARQIIHRDLKPSNVMVNSEGRVVVLDFGLVLESDKTASFSHLAGTPAYMSPEQASGKSVTAASDWYAVGIILYEALTGSRPHEGNVLNIIRQKLEGEVSLLDSEVLPSDLSDLANQLLRKDPEQRPDALAIAGSLSASAPIESDSIASHQPTLVGRSNQLSELKARYEEFIASHEPHVAFITGRSGEGKTALATNALESIDGKTAAAIMTARCYDRESVPFKALDGIVDALGSYINSLSEVKAALMLPDDIGILSHLFPVLQRVGVIANAPSPRMANISTDQVRARAFAAMRELLRRIGSNNPVILFIDDLQWGDADSAQALVEVLRTPDPPAVLLIGSYRIDEADSSPFISEWTKQQQRLGIEIEQTNIQVGPLDDEQCHQLMVNELGRDDETIRRRAVEFAKETLGNPYLMVELIGCFDPTSDSFETLQMNEVIDRKLHRLPSESQQLLQMVSVAGQATAIDEIAKAIGYESVPMSIVTKMQNERLIRLVGSKLHPKFDTYHDRIRETTLLHMEESESKTQHIDLAIAIAKITKSDASAIRPLLEFPERDDDGEKVPVVPRAYDLAYHFDHGGDKENAWIFALIAAEQAQDQFANAVAVEQFAIATRNASDVTLPATRYRIALGFGSALMFAGRFREARVQFELANSLATSDIQRARVGLKMGELEMKHSHITECVSLLADTMRSLGQRVPRTYVGFAIGVVKEAIIQIGHTYLPRSLHVSKRTKPDPREQIISQCLNSISYPFWFQSSIKLFWAHLRAINKGEKNAKHFNRELAEVYAHHAVVMSVVGMMKRGQAYAHVSRDLFKSMDEKWGVGSTHFFIGLGCYASGHYRQAIEELKQCEEILMQTGDPWLLNVGRYHIGLSHWMLGELDDAINSLRKTFQIGIQIEHDALSHYTLDGWAKAARGEIPFEDAKSCMRSIPTDVQSSNQLLQAEGEWHLHHGRTDCAIEAFEKAAKLLRENLLLSWPTQPTIPSLARALRLHADSIEQTDEPGARKIRKRALRMARRASWLFRYFPTDHSYSLREYALMLMIFGRHKKALRVIEKSCASAKSRDEAVQLAESRLVKGQIMQRLNIAQADEEIASAQEQLNCFQAVIDACEPERLG